MKNLFPGYYIPNDEEFKQLWEECIFCFYTNIRSVDLSKKMRQILDGTDL
jgi:hypothetical protein